MYVKLAISNAKKSIKDYLIYFITISICVSLFYAFTSLSSSSYELITEKSYNFENLEKMLKYSTYVITALLVLLIGYVNRYMIRRRQREFATYILLGAEQKSVALMFFIETLIIGIAAIIVGIFVGTLFSQAVTAIVLITAKQEVVFSFKLYMDTVAITFIFFISMFCIIGIYNIRVLKKLKLIDMINVENQVEFQFKRSKKVYCIVFIMAVVLYSVCGYCTFKLMEASNNFSVDLPNKLIIEGISLLTFIIGTYALFYSISYIMIYIKNKCVNLKYEGTNLFLIGSILSKIKSAPILMATISLTFLGAAISFTLTLIMSQWSLGYLDYRVPFDIYIRNEYSYGFREEYSLNDIKDIPKIDYSEVVNYLNDNNYDVESYCQLEKYFINKDDFYIRDENNIPIIAIKLSDFNKMRSMLEYKEVKLKDNEFTTQWHKMKSQSDINKYIKENSSIKVDGKTLKLSPKSYYKESLGEGIYNLYSENIIILPDKICKKLTIASTDFIANINNEVSPEKAGEIGVNYIPNWFKKNNKNLIKKYSKDKDIADYLIGTRVKSIETNTILNITLGMRILGIYLGVVLLMISLTVLSLTQLSDSLEHKERFNVLKKLGIEDREINKIILKQISLYFVIPIVIAVVGYIIFIYNYYILNTQIISSYVRDKVFILNIFIALVLMIFIYICYFTGTYYTFKRNIRS
ncbi:ABC transporter permease [[Clostridium] sordellii]|uniref:FtsX-like permease family protein n=1 Tax=Paraclostridium sordellii TaxID=1505 RepID=UPI0005E61D63|nr:FtsX-like permease family protein [Paeniclostridium sordellii]MBX9179474.1 FtsX-like permease family protein [Paeniclostridium sordellii]CEO12496.1 ABC transporter permease [[Clostridium] sordellii] [Paeniclostridium sordellii]CEP83515.1 ABC transporter permease [[Clostridium] sordellii] [Paeniclostridium sordellii]CEQ29733.1 ABC transporter permease [[Clostridium] sordellii] [Paeniclostridium sordellii]